MSGKRRGLLDGLQVRNLEELAHELGAELPPTEGDRLFREVVDRSIEAATRRAVPPLVSSIYPFALQNQARWLEREQAAVLARVARTGGDPDQVKRRARKLAESRPVDVVAVLRDDSLWFDEPRDNAPPRTHRPNP